MSLDPGSGHSGTARALTAAVAGLGGLIVFRCALPAATPQIRLNGKAGSARTIATLEKVRIGGSDQWAPERSDDVDNPVVLYLHGGPGTSQLTSNRRNTRHLEQFFTIVNWDQRGAVRRRGSCQQARRVRPGNRRPAGLAREYPADRFNFFRGSSGSMRALWPQLLEVDLFTSVPEMGVPVFFMEGRNEWEVPCEIAERYFDFAQGTGKGTSLV